MPSSRASLMTATPTSRGIRSYVLQDPRESSETSIPEEPSARRAITDAAYVRPKPGARIRMLPPMRLPGRQGVSRVTRAVG